mmetsp:Transcript_7486/g.12960  ORF Transcript_7486/g.12960 Transcript_7486/m.12960 type:complete len:452 (-) Transcript_7486:103-1458(-)
MTEMKQEERCQVVICRNGQDESNGLKILLKPGDSFRLGRARENEVVLDYDAASKHHAEISLHQTLPEEVPAGSDSKLPTVLSIRDLSSKNGIGIRKTMEQDAVPTVASFEQLEAKTSQVVEDGCCIVIPARSRRGDKQMTLRQRMITFRVKTVMVDVPVPKPLPPSVLKPTTAAPLQPAPVPTAPVREEAPVQVTAAAYADLAEVVKLTDTPTGKPAQEAEVFVRPAEAPGLPTMTPGEVEGRDVSMPKEVEGRDVPAPKEVEGRDVPAPKEGGLTQRAFGSLWRGRRAKAAPPSSEDESNRAFTKANVARVSAAAARAAGVLEPLPEMDFELRSVSPISTPGVFPWQLSMKKKEKKAKKKKRAPSPSAIPPSTRAASPGSSVVTEVTVPAPKKRKEKGSKAKEPKAPKKRKEKGEKGEKGEAKASKSKKPKLTASSGMKWDPYMQRDSSP